MTGQSLLDRMELLNAELQLQSGENDVTRGLLALNIAQDYFEALAAQRSQLFWGTSTGDVTTANGVETTVMPTGLLRIDKMQLLDSSSRIKRDLYPIERVGGHRASSSWPLSLFTSTASGEPVAYWVTGSNIYWQPLPSGVSTVRWMGFKSASDLTAAATFLYPDVVALPMAAFAVQIIKVGLDDDPSTLSSLAGGTFSSVLDTLEGINRDGPKGLHYSRVHTE